MRPRVASVLFGQAVDAIRRGRIRQVLRAIATSSRKRARSIILATEAARSDGEFEGLLKLYSELNAAEIDAKQTPSVSGKAKDLARVIRRLTTIQRISGLRQMFGEIELKPSARDIVVAVLTIGDVDDVTATLLKIDSFPNEIGYENHMEPASRQSGR